MSEARAVYFVGERSVEVRPVPVKPGPGEAMVESRLIGISHGTELLCYRGQLPARDSEETLEALPDSLAYPLRYGYINVGAREDGTPVFAFYPHQDRFAAPPETMIELPRDLEADNAVFLASMETALGIVHDAAPRLGETVAVIGTGVIGLLAASLLLRTGVHVIAVEPGPLRRRHAREAGCRVIDPATEPAVPRLFEETDGRGVDVAINTSAADAGLQTAIDAACLEGRVIEASWHGSRMSTLRLGESFHRRRLTVRSSQVSRLGPELAPRWDKARRMRFVTELLAELEPARFITHRFALSEAASAFRLIDEHPDDTLQVVLDPTA